MTAARTPCFFPAWRRAVASLLAGLMALPMAPALAQVRLPSLGESASLDMTVGAERRLGEQIMREARRDPLFLDDPVLLEYVQSLWDPLVAAARQVGNIDGDTDQAFPFEIFLVRERSVNAFAWPGGFVGTHLGLIALTNTPDQLASVLAHELTHVTQRHIARSIAPQQQASMLSIAALLLGILAASRTGNADVANAAIVGSQAGAIQAQLNFSRDVEREADRIGFGLMEVAGFAPSGMSAMFEKMDQSSRLNDNGGFPYLRSHPLTVDRISESRNRVLLSHSAPSRPTLRHAMMQMRARVLMDDSTLSLQRLSGASSSPLLAERVGALYGGALAASLLKDHARAQTLVASGMQLAATASPREPQAERGFQLLQAQILLNKRDPQGALTALQSLPAAAAERPTMLLRAQAALDLRRNEAGATPVAETAATGPANPVASGPAASTAAAGSPLRNSTEALQTWLAEHPHDAMAWETLASTSDALGMRLRSMRAGAEARAAVGDYTGAIDRLRAAQGISRQATGQDFIEASVVDARLRQLNLQRRQFAAELRGDKEPRNGPPPDEPPP